MNVGSVIVDIATNLTRFEAGLRQATRDARDAARAMEQSFRNAFGQVDNSASALRRNLQEIGRIVSGILISQAFYNSMNAIENAAGAVFEFSMRLEDAQTKWTSLMGSSDMADKWIAAMQDFAQRTPFDFESVDESAGKIRLMGVEARHVLPILEQLGNAVAIGGGDSLTLKNLTKAMSQMFRSPKAQAEEVEQFIEGQIDAARYLREQLGLTAEQVKNIGDSGVSGKQATLAILRGIATDPAYKDGMKKLSENTRGMINSIKEGSKYLASLAFAPVYKEIGKAIKGIRDTIDDMIHTYRKTGLGGIFEKFVPKSLQDDVRLIVASIKSMWDSTISIFKTLAPFFASFAATAVQALGVLLPVLANLLKYFSYLLQVIQPILPLLGKLAFAFAALLIARTAALSIAILTRALMFLWGALRVGGALVFLRGALVGLMRLIFLNPWVAAIGAIVYALYKLAMSSKVASEWIKNLLARLAQLFGLDTSNILKPITNPEADDLEDFIEDMNKGFEDIGDTAGGVGDDLGSGLEDGAKDGTKKAKKEMEKFLASFDEVFSVPEQKKDDGGGSGDKGGGGGGGGAGGGGGLGDIDLGSDKGIPDQLDKIIPKEIPIEIVPIFRPLKPINIKINWDWFPGPPGAAATVWETTMNRLREALRALNPVGVVFGGVLGGIVAGLAGSRDKVKEFLKNLSPLGETVGDFAKRAKEGFDRLLDTLGSIDWGSILHGVAHPMEGLKKVFEGLWDKLPEGVKNVGPALKTGFKVAGDVAILAIKGMFKGKLDAFKEGWSNIGQKIQDGLAGIKKFWEEHKTGVLLVVSGIVLGVVAFFAGIPAAIGTAIVGFGVWIVDQFDKVKEDVVAFFDGSNIKDSILTAFVGKGGGKGSSGDGLSTGLIAPFKNWEGDVGKYLEKVYKYFEGIDDKFTGFLKDVGKKLSEPFEGWPDAIEGFVDDVKQFFKDLPGNLKDGLKTVKDKITSPFKDWPDGISGFVEKVKKFFKDLPDNLKEFLKTAKEKVTTPFKDWPGSISDFVDEVKQFFIDLPENIKTFLSKVPDKLLTPFSKFPEDVKGKVDSAVDWVKGIPKRIEDGLKPAPGKLSTPFGGFPKAVQDKVDAAVAWVKGIPKRIEDGLKNAPGKLSGPFGGFPKAVQDKVDDAVAWVKGIPKRIEDGLKNAPGKLSGPFGGFPGDVEDKVDDAIAWVKGIPKRIEDGLDKVPSKLKSPFSSFKGDVQTVIDEVVKKFEALPGLIVEAIKSIPAKIAEVLSKIKLPSFSVIGKAVKATWNVIGPTGFANGGIIGKESIVRVGEKGRREAIIPLQNGNAMAPFADAVAQRLGGLGNNNQPVLYVGNLIADERSLRELERKMQVIRLNESNRGGGRF